MNERTAMRTINIMTAVKIHFVIPDASGEMFNAHTHGLEAFGHKEFQVLVPGFCRSAAADVLNNHADRVINRGELFRPGDTGEVDGMLCGYIEVPGDCPCDPSRIRIVHLPSRFYPSSLRAMSRL